MKAGFGIFHGEILREIGKPTEALAVLTDPALASTRAEALHLAVEIAVDLGMNPLAVDNLRQKARALRMPLETGMSGNPQVPYVIDRTKYVDPA